MSSQTSTQSSPIRVLLLGTGQMGSGIARLVTDKKGLELVGAFGRRRERLGVDLGHAIGLDRDLQIPISGDLATTINSTRPQIAVQATCSRLADAFEEARSKGLGSDDLAKVACAAAESRIGSLLVEAERRIPGLMDKGTGGITFSRLEDPQVDDLLDDLAELVLNKGGQVVVVPAVDMPVTTGVAATFRF